MERTYLEQYAFIFSVISSSQVFSIYFVSQKYGSLYNNEILPAIFTIYRRDRCTRGGGVLIAVSNAISSRLEHPQTLLS